MDNTNAQGQDQTHPSVCHGRTSLVIVKPRSTWNSAGLMARHGFPRHDASSATLVGIDSKAVSEGMTSTR